ncbi:MAG TPA: acetyl-CoA carboxylase biotin carboxyl carrier protein [Candidatus Acutalibacter stercoravium]|nr:acetyl-CoA carboxylase biotin carboxyl carrier protein [Candidatus Acutalibacter stercoravium]
MDVKKIESLAKLMKETGLTGLELVEDGQQLRLERQVEVVAAPVAAPAPAAPVPAASGAEALGVTHEEPAPVKEGTLVLAPTVGVFYSAPSPDARPFVEVGDQVKKGDTLCIIEAMKLMNEIPAEVDGTVAEICVGNGQVVEFNQPLFRIV